MSKQRRDRLFLGDIAEAIGRIIAYTGKLSYEQFLGDTMVQDAVLRNLQVIGEATKRLSPSLRDALPALPWREMAGMRDKIVHEYFARQCHIQDVSRCCLDFIRLLRTRVRLTRCSTTKPMASSGVSSGSGIAARSSSRTLATESAGSTSVSNC